MASEHALAAFVEDVGGPDGLGVEVGTSGEVPRPPPFVFLAGGGRAGLGLRGPNAMDEAARSVGVGAAERKARRVVGDGVG